MAKEFDPLYRETLGKVEIIENGYAYPATILTYNEVGDSYEVQLKLPRGHSYLMTVDAWRVRGPKKYKAGLDKPTLEPVTRNKPVEEKTEGSKKKKYLGAPKPKFQINDYAIYTSPKDDKEKECRIVGWGYRRVDDHFEYWYKISLLGQDSNTWSSVHELGQVFESELSELKPKVEEATEPKFKGGDRVKVIVGNGTAKFGTVVREDINTWAIDRKEKYWLMLIDGNNSEWAYPESRIALIEKRPAPKFDKGDLVQITNVNLWFYKEVGTIAGYIYSQEKNGEMCWSYRLTDNEKIEGAGYFSETGLSAYEKPKTKLEEEKDENPDEYQEIIDEAHKIFAPILNLKGVSELGLEPDFKKVIGKIGPIVEFFSKMADFDPEDGKKKEKKDG